MVEARRRPMSGPMPSSGGTASSGAGRAGAGYARHGFRIKFFLARPTKGETRGAAPKAIADPTYLGKILNLATTELQSSSWRSRFMYTPTIAKYLPFFRLANYTKDEQKGMRRLHPHPGGTLIRSGKPIAVADIHNSAILVTFEWATPYLGYLIKRGVSREPGTTVNFWPVIRATNYLQVSVKNLLVRLANIETKSNISRWVHQAWLGDF